MPSQPHDSPLCHRPISSIGFIVNDRPIAVYGADLRESTHEFIRTFSADFWGHQVTLATSVPRDNVSNEHVAFVRLALSHAQEHLFALVFSFLQAPFSPDLWLYHYKPSDLPAMVEKVANGGHILTQFGLGETSWKSITRVIWPWLGEEEYEATNRMLGVLATHFMNDHRKGEYNGLKHGLRLSLGGISISFSPGGSPDEKPSPESYISLAQSKFGCRFWSFEKIPGRKDHMVGRSRVSNWDFGELGFYLTHTAMLIGNMGSAFRVFSKIEGDTEFHFFKKCILDQVESHFLDDMIGSMVSEFDSSLLKLIDLEAVRKQYS